MKTKLAIQLIAVVLVLSSLQQILYAQSWSITGNNGTTPNTNFVGTKDNKALAVRTNNVERMRIRSNGDVGIGTTNPKTKLHVDNGTYVNLQSGGYTVLGNTTGFNMGLDVNIIQTRNDNSASDLYLNYYGGGVWIGNHSGITTPAIYTAPDGKVAIGTNNVDPNAALTLDGNSGLYGIVATSTSAYSAFYIYNYGSGSAIEASGENGNGIYATTFKTGAYAAFFDGDVYCNGNYLGSDQTLKQNIKEFPTAMNIINQLHPKQYQFRQDGNYKLMNLPQGDHYGLIAQDVEKILPNLVKDTKFETRLGKPHIVKEDVKSSETISFKALNYTELIPVMIKGMQEQQRQIDELKKMVEMLGGDADTSKSL